MQQATGETEPEQKFTGKEADSSKGRKAGGKARAKKLTPEERSEIAKKAAQVRWQPYATILASAVSSRSIVKLKTT